MIQFFRRIRQKLVTEGSFSRYLIYAIGEILLVVIGILIALQINNWNEQNKTKELEKALLLEYQAELRFNYDELNRVIDYFNDNMNSCSVLLDQIEFDRPYTDSLSFKFSVLTRSVGTYVIHVAFKALEDQGVDIISNKNLKNEILNLHSKSYHLLDGRIENQMSNIKEYGRPIVRNQLKALTDRKYVPINYKELMDDVALWNILMILKGNYLDLDNIMKDAQIEIAKVDELITKELN